MDEDKDIVATISDGLEWNAAEIEKSLAAVRTHVVKEAVTASEWYFRRKRSKALLSQALRLGSILAASAGGLFPIAATWASSGAGSSSHAGLGASLLVGLAAALIGVDKAFGFSSGWIRYVTTASLIRRALEDFRIQWTFHLAQAHGALEQPKILELLQLARTFRLLVESHVLEETKAWTSEFNGGLAQLERKDGTPLDAKHEPMALKFDSLKRSNGGPTDDCNTLQHSRVLG